MGDNSIMGDRRHKDEIDSADDSDGKGDDEVNITMNNKCSKTRYTLSPLRPESDEIIGLFPCWCVDAIPVLRVIIVSSLSRISPPRLMPGGSISIRSPPGPASAASLASQEPRIWTSSSLRPGLGVSWARTQADSTPTRRWQITANWAPGPWRRARQCTGPGTTAAWWRGPGRGQTTPSWWGAWPWGRGRGCTTASCRTRTWRASSTWRHTRPPPCPTCPPRTSHQTRSERNNVLEVLIAARLSPGFPKAVLWWTVNVRFTEDMKEQQMSEVGRKKLSDKIAIMILCKMSNFIANIEHLIIQQINALLIKTLLLLFAIWQGCAS